MIVNYLTISKKYTLSCEKLQLFKYIWGDIQLMLSLVQDKEAKVLIFLLEWGRPVRVGEMKRYLEFPHSTLNSIVKRLEGKGYVDWEEYSNVSLTDLGEKTAIHLLKHHNIMHHYLVNTLGIKDQIAHEDSLKVAGIISCEVIEAMKKSNESCDLDVCKVILKDAVPFVNKDELEIC
ncbi:MAG: metal-dependent transcriptional regulator [Methanobacteriota archaeon]|nr:MAG: metal-dependent transcriptional regulator [Euryarchaeota archaeon]